MPKHTEIWIDRGANPQLLDALKPGEPMHGVIEWRNFDVLHRDVQLRKRRQSSWSYVSLYVGLTAVLEIHACGDGLKFNAHGTHRDAGAFDDAWKRPMTTEAAQAEWPRISRYLDRATLAVAPRHITNEGLVHAALCSGQSDQYRVINREVSPNFTDTAARKAIEGELGDPIRRAAQTAERSLRGSSRGEAKAFGTGTDILAADNSNRLLVIEAKPSRSKEILSAPKQVIFYAGILQRWIAQDPGAAVNALNQMLDQRVTLGLTSPGPQLQAQGLRIVPVVAIGPGLISADAERRMLDLSTALTNLSMPSVDPIECWRLDALGGYSTLG